MCERSLGLWLEITSLGWTCCFRLRGMLNVCLKILKWKRRLLYQTLGLTKCMQAKCCKWAQKIREEKVLSTLPALWQVTTVISSCHIPHVLKVENCGKLGWLQGSKVRFSLVIQMSPNTSNIVKTRSVGSCSLRGSILVALMQQSHNLLCRVCHSTATELLRNGIQTRPQLYTYSTLAYSPEQYFELFQAPSAPWTAMTRLSRTNNIISQRSNSGTSQNHSANQLLCTLQPAYFTDSCTSEVLSTVKAPWVQVESA